VLPTSLPSPPSDWASFEFPLTGLRDFVLGIFPDATWFPGQFVIHVYALAILVGILAAVLVANYRLTKRGAEPWIVVDIAIWAVVFGIVGSRVWHVATHPADYFGPGINPMSALYVWEGGVAIFGAILGGALGAWIASRQLGLRFTAVADAIAPTLLLAQAFGRLGNYFNQELFGLPTNLPWGLEIDRPNPAIPVGIPTDALFHPTFLYEIVWNLAGFAILLLIENRVSISTVASRVGGILPFSVSFTRRDAWYWGKMMGLWAIWYGVGRVWFESIRLDPSETFLGIRSNVWGALAAIVLGIVILVVQSKRHPGIEPSVYRPGKEWVPESEVDSDQIYSDSDEAGDGAGTSPAPATSGSPRT
jgi:prolipoprotein diacylglyceryl transferase